MKAEIIKGVNVKNGVTYMSLSKVVEDYKNGVNKTEDIDCEVISPLKIDLKVISDQQVMDERNDNYEFFSRPE